MKVLIDRDDLREVLGYAAQHIPDGTAMTDPQGDAWERLWAVVDAPTPPTTTDPAAGGLDADGIAAALRTRGFVERGSSLLMPTFVNEHTGVTATITRLPIPVLSVSLAADAADDRCTHPWQLLTEADIERLLAGDPVLPRQEGHR
jgi:hypothetical protein